MSDLHHRSGSTQELRFFARDLRRFVATTKLFPLPDYDLFLREGRDEMVLHMVRRAESDARALEAPASVLENVGEP